MAAAVLVAGVPRPAEVADAGVFRRAGAAPVAGGAAVVEAGALAGVDAVAGETAVAGALEAGLGVVAGRWIVCYHEFIGHPVACFGVKKWECLELILPSLCSTGWPICFGKELC